MPESISPDGTVHPTLDTGQIHPLEMISPPPSSGVLPPANTPNIISPLEISPENSPFSRNFSLPFRHPHTSPSTPITLDHGHFLARSGDELASSEASEGGPTGGHEDCSGYNTGTDSDSKDDEGVKIKNGEDSDHAQSYTDSGPVSSTEGEKPMNHSDEGQDTDIRDQQTTFTCVQQGTESETSKAKTYISLRRGLHPWCLECDGIQSIIGLKKEGSDGDDPKVFAYCSCKKGCMRNIYGEGKANDISEQMGSVFETCNVPGMGKSEEKINESDKTNDGELEIAFQTHMDIQDNPLTTQKEDSEAGKAEVNGKSVDFESGGVSRETYEED
jgi:hypothetical protein